MTKKEYNGWTNYETWNVALWLDNEMGSYEDMRDAARSNRSANKLADYIKSYVEDAAPDLGASMFSDLLSAALSEVDYYEIAEHYLSDVGEEEEESVLE